MATGKEMGSNLYRSFLYHAHYLGLAIKHMYSVSHRLCSRDKQQQDHMAAEAVVPRKEQEIELDTFDLEKHRPLPQPDLAYAAAVVVGCPPAHG